METQEQCDFFKVPRELRQNIYDKVIFSDIGHQLVLAYKDGRGKGQYLTTTTLVKNSGAHLSIPWLNLLSTCKAIKLEISAYMKSLSFLSAEQSRTYILDLVGVVSYLGPATWRQIPCRPSEVEELVVNFDLRYKRLRAWGDGPTPILRQLYQTLNLILHHGPIFSRNYPLKQHLSLKSLVFHVATRRRSDKLAHANAVDMVPDKHFSTICGFVQRLASTGLLSGCVDRVILTNGSSRKVDILIRQVENTAVPAFWDRYGFEWGPRERG